jgi:hypothetical protein
MQLSWDGPEQRHGDATGVDVRESAGNGSWSAIESNQSATATSSGITGTP